MGTSSDGGKSEGPAQQIDFRLMAELAADPVAVHDQGGVIVWANAAAAALVRAPSAESLVGMHMLGFVAPEHREAVLARAAALAADGGAVGTLEEVFVRLDGTRVEVETSGAALGGGRTIIVVRDVSRRAAAERAQRESERRFRELFEFVPVSLFEVDVSGVRAALTALRDGGVADLRSYVEAHPELVGRMMKSFTLLAVNAAGRALVGATSMDDLLANFEKVYPPETFPRYRELGLQLAEGHTTVSFDGWVGTLTGERRWIETTATLVPGHEADWSRLLVASTDVTDRRRAEEERAALHERLRLSEKLEAVGRLAGGIAHDFNNILSGILGYTELTILGLERGSELYDHQQRIREATLRARDLVRQILAFSRRDSANRQVVDVPTVVREALTLMRAGIPASVTVETRIDTEAGTTLADPTQLHQIVLNLASNARDAVSSYGRIEFAVEAIELKGEIPGLPSGRYVRLRVKDDGLGMDEATRARLFEPYMTTKALSGGHGLGLAVVHGIVAAAGGAIQVESAPGEGSTFDVYLPRSELSAARDSGAAAPALWAGRADPRRRRRADGPECPPAAPGVAGLRGGGRGGRRAGARPLPRGAGRVRPDPHRPDHAAPLGRGSRAHGPRAPRRREGDPVHRLQRPRRRGARPHARPQRPPHEAHRPRDDGSGLAEGARAVASPERADRLYL